MTTARELYAREPQDITTEVLNLCGCYYNHIPELEDYRYENYWKNQDRVKIKILKHFDFDDRRFWEMTTIWFDNKPVMITQNAGREGDDFAERFVTDKNQYELMVRYLLTFVPVQEPTDVVSEDGQIPTAFYGNELDGYFERY